MNITEELYINVHHNKSKNTLKAILKRKISSVLFTITLLCLALVITTVILYYLCQNFNLLYSCVFGVFLLTYCIIMLILYSLTLYLTEYRKNLTGFLATFLYCIILTLILALNSFLKN